MAGFQEVSDHLGAVEVSRLPWNGVPINIPLGLNEAPQHLDGLGATDQLPLWVLPVGAAIVGILLLKAFENTREEFAIRSTASKRAKDRYDESLRELRARRKAMKSKLRSGDLYDGPASLT